MIRRIPLVLLLLLGLGAPASWGLEAAAAEPQGGTGARAVGAVPLLESEALDGRVRRIPGDFGGGRTAVVLSFRRDDFEGTLEWMAALGSAPRVHMPVFPRSIRWLRPLIEGGLRDRVAPPDHARVWPIWGDPAAVRAAVLLGEDERIAVVVVDATGTVHSVERGTATPAAVDRILQKVRSP